ncbi:MAG: Crp/Fnr family transcriptional regulator [Flavisolibacter sp.]
MSDPNVQLHQMVQALHPLTTQEWEAFEAVWKPYDLKRREMITVAGDREKYLYFVIEGVQRIYFLDDHDREATLVFTYAPSFGGVLDAFLLQQPSKYFYETITASKFLRASSEHIEELMSAWPGISIMIRKGLTHAFAGLLERQAELQCFSSEEKFRRLLKRSPHILNIVPQKYLADYLGIDATNFSKLVNKIRI